MVRHRAGQAGIAQSVEHFTRNEGVVGSSPISGLQKKRVVISGDSQDSGSYGSFLLLRGKDNIEKRKQK